MSVEITFEPIGLSGLVAEGTYLADAARRMGAPLSFDCRSKGECVSCQVTIQAGAQLLSAPTAAEQNLLGPQGLSNQQRLACQVRIEKAGEVVVHINPEKPQPESKPSDVETMRKKFGELALDKKLITLMQFEAMTMFEALNAVMDKPRALGERLFDRYYNKAKIAEREKRNQQKPPEHR